MSSPLEQGQFRLDQPSHQLVRQRIVDAEVERPRRALIARKLIAKFSEYGATVGKVGEVLLERRQPSHDLPIDSESGEPVGKPSSASGTTAWIDRRTASSVLRLGSSTPAR